MAAAPGHRQGAQHSRHHSPGALLHSGRYRVLRKLNRGATAVVYAAEDLHTGAQVALKVMHCASNKVLANVVQREVALSSHVAHDNMVTMFTVFSEGEEELVIVWELVAGPDLLELLNECNGRMDEGAAAFYFAQLLRGVLHMHANNFCHRDIKPENCMVERATQRLKLIDFGLAKHLDSVATLGVGTPDYMAPELVRAQIKQGAVQQAERSGGAGSGQPYDAKAVDAWAMGVLLYLLVSGTYPFEDPRQPNNLAATILRIQAGRCQPLPPGVSPGCRAVIGGLLCPDPERRTRLEDLARHPWLLQSAAAHAVRLGPLGAAFDFLNPLWLLPSSPAGGGHLPAPHGGSLSPDHSLDGSPAAAGGVHEAARSGANSPELLLQPPPPLLLPQHLHQLPAASSGASSSSGTEGPATAWHSFSSATAGGDSGQQLAQQQAAAQHVLFAQQVAAAVAAAGVGAADQAWDPSGGGHECSMDVDHPPFDASLGHTHGGHCFAPPAAPPVVPAGLAGCGARERAPHHAGLLVGLARLPAFVRKHL